MKISLVLSGGGARGAYHLGVLQYIDEMGIKIEAISGSSIGGVVGVFYAAGISPKKQLELFKSKQFKKAIQFNWFKNGAFCFNQNSEIFDILSIKNIEDLPIKIYITAVDLLSEETLVFDKGEIIPLCLGSSALPLLFTPISYNSFYLVDGGITENLPIKPLLEHHNTPIVSVNLHPFKKKKNNNGMFTIFKNMVSLSWLYSVQINLRDVDLKIENEDILNYSIVGFKNLDRMFEMGYLDAKKSIGQRPFN